MGVQNHEIFDYQVVIPTKNGASRGIENIIKTLRNQSIQPSKIYIVDNLSNDNTQELCRSYGCEILEYFKPINHSEIRNYALTVIGETKFTLFTCDDVKFTDSKWIENAIHNLVNNESVACSGSQKVPAGIESNWLSVLLSFLSSKNIANLKDQYTEFTNSKQSEINMVFLD